MMPGTLGVGNVLGIYAKNSRQQKSRLSEMDKLSLVFREAYF